MKHSARLSCLRHKKYTDLADRVGNDCRSVGDCGDRRRGDEDGVAVVEPHRLLPSDWHSDAHLPAAGAHGAWKLVRRLEQQEGRRCGLAVGEVASEDHGTGASQRDDAELQCDEAGDEADLYDVVIVYQLWCVCCEFVFQ